MKKSIIFLILLLPLLILSCSSSNDDEINQLQLQIIELENQKIQQELDELRKEKAEEQANLEAEAKAANEEKKKAEAEAKAAKEKQEKAEAKALSAKSVKEKAEAETEAKIAKENKEKAEAEAKAAIEEKIKAEAEARFAKENKEKAEADLKTTSKSSKSYDSVVEVKPIYEVTPLISVINYTNYDNDYISRSIELADSKMKDRRASILAFIYPVGEPTLKLSSNGRYMSHDVLMSWDEINSMHKSIENWMENNECLRNDKRNMDWHLDLYRDWLKNGMDASTMQAICGKETRIVAMGVTKMMREREPIEEFQDFLIHEFYHAFQQDLENEGECRRSRDQEDSNRVWMVEGAAHYFSTMMVHEFNNTPDPHNKLFEIVYKGMDRLDLYNDGPDKTGAVALYLMTKLGMLDEKSIMDGSLFHNCDTEFLFDKNSSEIKHIKNSWNKIKESGDYKYSFSSDALKFK